MRKQTYKNTELKHGVYYLYWKSGGSSVASVGLDREGNLWYAPANWITVPCFDWRKIERVELIQVNNYDN